MAGAESGAASLILTFDGRWFYSWNGENRLAAMEEGVGGSRPVKVLRQRLKFTYDSQGRRVRKVLKDWDALSETFALKQDTRFLYDGWNVIAEFESSPGGPVALKATYAWGLDLSGTDTGAGGVGGLLFAKLHSAPGAPVLAPCYDGTQGDWRESRETNRRFARQGETSARRERVNCSGNILAYLDCATGQALARYEYDPFGKLLLKDEDTRVAGRLHHQFSTKYTDEETRLAYYGYRYYAPELGRWVNRDPIGERGGVNIYCIVGNDVLNEWDRLGLFGPAYFTATCTIRAMFPSPPKSAVFFVGCSSRREVDCEYDCFYTSVMPLTEEPASVAVNTNGGYYVKILFNQTGPCKPTFEETGIHGSAP